LQAAASSLHVSHLHQGKFPSPVDGQCRKA
jgi:hypothetical protein